MEQEVPEEFRLFCVLFDEGSCHNLTTCENRIDFALTELIPDQMVGVKNYLDELLSGKYTDRQLTDLWESTPTAGAMTFWGRADKSAEPRIIYAFKLMRSRIEQKLAERS